MSQTVILKDLLSKYLEKISTDYELHSLDLSEKWALHYDSLFELSKPIEILANNHVEPSISSCKVSKTEAHLRKQSSISENLAADCEKGKHRGKNEQIFQRNEQEILPNKSFEENLQENDSKNRYYTVIKAANFIQKRKIFTSHDIENLDIMGSYVLELANCHELLLKNIAIAHFLNLLVESFSEQAATANSLYEVYSRINSKQIVLNPHNESIFSEDQLKLAFLSNIKKVLMLKSQSNVPMQKLCRCFTYLIWQKPLFLESLMVYVKEITLYKLKNNEIFAENRDFMINSVSQLWAEPKRELLRLVCEALNRNIEFYDVNEEDFNLHSFKPEQLMEEERKIICNKISIIGYAKGEEYMVSLVLNQLEKEYFEKFDCLSKEDITFLEDSKNSTMIIMKNPVNAIKVNEWKKTNQITNKVKEILEAMNYNTEKMNVYYKAAANYNEYKENIVPKEQERSFISTGGNKVERIELYDRSREKSRSRSPMIYYNNQQNGYNYDNRLKTITTISSGYVNANPVVVDNRVKRHYTTNHLPTIGNNLFGYN